MNKAKLIFLSAMLLAASAVGVVGFVVTRPAPKPPSERTWLPDELHLTPEQKSKMEAIWRGTMETVTQKGNDRRRTLRDERDAAINEILTPDQKLYVEEVQQQYSKSLHELDRLKDEAFKKAVEETTKILSPEQIAKYEKMLSERRAHGDGHHPSGGPRHPDGRSGDGHSLIGGSDFRPTSQHFGTPSTRPVGSPSHVE